MTTRKGPAASPGAPSNVARNQGVSLVEMLVALVVLSFGLLGIAALQAQSLRHNLDAFHRSQATALGNALLDRLRANREAARDAATQQYDFSSLFDYGSTADPDYPPPAVPSGDPVVASDLATWVAQLGTLPAGTGAVDCEESGVCVVVVEWDETRTGVAGAETRLHLSTRL
ncbi:MAG: type IV pilus modification protein PilV [Gammaproteobacteria bacterium]|jgi:type IV pilus assembly protein PilV|nr:type IV pilus modification protein PilV [Gammaproteobacteria bacterium]